MVLRWCQFSPIVSATGVAVVVRSVSVAITTFFAAPRAITIGPVAWTTVAVVSRRVIDLSTRGLLGRASGRGLQQGFHVQT